ncbi:PREDICTED: septin-5-like [Priapulus caudatus]|uniref:Septin n=1 Tax=Priapulus caudatus TaxID=37621 RepID=A0ABM1F501_PRICU|nr:PREDICTED: septin-5-like [Priapulus caudatus]
MTSPLCPRKRDEQDREYIGFACLPEQVHRKTVKRGFDFTLMVAGEAGLGKSTLVNSLFLSDLYKSRAVPSVEERISKTTEIDKKTLDIEEKGVKLRLTVVDTPGFGDQVNVDDCWKPIEKYIDDQFAQYFKDESGLNRKNITDNRVHCCLYFISPYGRGLRPLDVEFMKRIHNKVNIVPLISKADTLTPSEIRKLKEKILQEIQKHQISIYTFPECDEDEDDDFKEHIRELKEAIPFAVIGSNTVVEVNGKKVRGRLYPWGIVEVDNPRHCDFTRLRTMLISTHMHDLKDMTQDVHYENYRSRCISNITAQTTRERTKLKRDSCNFEAMSDADRLLREKDEEIARMQQMLSQMAAQMHRGTMNGHK